MILKIDTTNSEEVSVEILKNGKKIGKIVERNKKGSQKLLPGIVRILERNGIRFSNLSGIKVNTGPGSFTGTRVGVAIANALGFALDIPVNSKRGKLAQAKYAKSKFG